MIDSINIHEVMRLHGLLGSHECIMILGFPNLTFSFFATKKDDELGGHIKPIKQVCSDFSHTHSIWEITSTQIIGNIRVVEKDHKL
jgi:hypothetical protein